jgi:hypothetical protein
MLCAGSLIGSSSLLASSGVKDVYELSIDVQSVVAISVICLQTQHSFRLLADAYKLLEALLH